MVQDIAKDGITNYEGDIIILMAYTDAPIIALGDDPCVRAPIRAIQVMSYDGEDECWVKILGGDGMGTTIKADRIYKNPVRFRQKAARLDFDELLS